MSRLALFLKSDELKVRVRTLLILSTVVFFGSTVISMVFCSFLLPRRLLLAMYSLTGVTTFSSSFFTAMQVIFSNLASVIIIVIINQHRFPGKDTDWVPLGYWCLMWLFALNGITLGAWFIAATNQVAPTLAGMQHVVFGVIRRIRLCEMIGKVLIISATARVAATEERRQRVPGEQPTTFTLTDPEKLAFAAGAILIVAEAIVASGLAFA